MRTLLHRLAVGLPLAAGLSVLLAACGGGGGGGAGTPAYPPTSVGLGNDSTSVPLSAPSMVAFQMSDGRPEPYTGPPPLFTSGCVPAVVPTHTAVDSDGV